MENEKRLNPFRKSIKELKKSLFLLIAVVFTLLIMLFGGYYYLESSKLNVQSSKLIESESKVQAENQNEKPANQTQKPSPIISTKPEQDTFEKTENWKTYTNTELKFSFKYPDASEWRIKENETGITPHIYNLPTLYNYDVDNAPGRDYIPSVDGDIFKVEMRISGDEGNVNKWFEQEKKNTTSTANGSPLEFRNIKQMKISGKNAVYYEVKTITGLYCPVVAIEHTNNRLFHLNPGLSCEKFQPIFSQILSTFRFN